jgi:hypothetical protein
VQRAPLRAVNRRNVQKSADARTKTKGGRRRGTWRSIADDTATYLGLEDCYWCLCYSCVPGGERNVTTGSDRVLSMDLCKSLSSVVQG